MPPFCNNHLGAYRIIKDLQNNLLGIYTIVEDLYNEAYAGLRQSIRIFATTLSGCYTIVKDPKTTLIITTGTPSNSTVVRKFRYNVQKMSLFQLINF